MILAAGKVPTSVSKFLAGGCLIALNTNKKGFPPDIRPIAVGETIRRLLVSSLAADEECAEILLQAWYLDD